MRYLLLTLLFATGALAQAPVGPGTPTQIPQPTPVGPGTPVPGVSAEATGKQVASLSPTQREFFDAVLKYSEKHDRSSLASTKSAAVDMLVGPGVPKAGAKSPKPKTKPATPQQLASRLNRADEDTQKALQVFLDSLTAKPADNGAAIRTMAPKTSGDLKATLDSVLKQETK